MSLRDEFKGSPEHEAVCRAITVMGGVLPTARQIGIKHPTVYQWQSGLVPVSMESAQKLEEVSGVPAESMSRPLREMLQRQRELYAKRVA